MESISITDKIVRGEIDINNQELFFSHLIKGLLIKLNGDISIRGIEVPHIIIHTGSDALYLENKGQDYSIEPYSVSNENYIYTIIPRCVVTPGGINLIPDQLTNPYSRGYLQYEDEGNLYNLSAEFRRLPIKLSVDLKYYTDSYRDLLELTQQILTKLAFIKTYPITYMGQQIMCSYKIPESFSDEHITELDGKTQDNKCHVLSLSIEVETNLPVYENRTVVNTDKYITKSITNVSGDEINKNKREIN